jgi:DNA-binding response OmpR family regulator
MRVLLLSDNHTVQKMISIALREEEKVELVTAPSADQVEPTSYDLILVDDALSLYHESIALLQTLGVDTIILLAHGGRHNEDHAVEILHKPFLPAEVRELIQKQRKKSAAKSSKKKHKKKKKHASHASRTEVLDLDEIETIKALLEEEGLEIIHEEELADQVLGENIPSTEDRHAALIEALRSMRPKKIRKMLKGATVRIEITFPENRQ